MALSYSFPKLEAVSCLLTHIQVSQETGKMVWYSHGFKNFPLCCDPHSKRLLRNETEVDILLEFSCFP